MRRRLLAAVGVVVLLAGACDEGEAPSDPTSAPRPDAVDDVSVVDLGPQPAFGEVSFDLPAGTRSVVFTARAESSDAEVAIVEVRGPDGILYAVDEDDIPTHGPLDDVIVDIGEVAVMLPLAPGDDPAPGRYTVTVDGTDDFEASSIIVRTGDVDGPQVVDVRFWWATSPDVMAGHDGDELRDVFAERADEIFGPHDLAVGEMSFIEAPADVVDRYGRAELDADGEVLKEACGVMARELGPARAVDIILVDLLVGGEEGYEDDEGFFEGQAAGLPGTVLVDGSTNSCVMVAAAEDEEGYTLLDRATTVWHEAGHFLGLFHTTESDGTYFDPLDDTPRCAADEYDADDDGYLDFYDECWDADGRNFMFHDSDETEMTDDQAWIVRRHPAFRPAA